MWSKAAKQRRKKGIWSTKHADNKFSLFIRERDKRCLKCGTREGLTCSHYHRRSHSSTRFDEDNCISLCWDCHAEWEGPKEEYTVFMLKRLGEKGFIELAKKAGKIVKRADAVALCKKHLTEI